MAECNWMFGVVLQLPAGVSTAGMTIYAIGDNPMSDIRGANAVRSSSDPIP
jgi:ribonucleotide monophosphatase NagD (HAD superfamily)